MPPVHADGRALTATSALSAVSDQGASSLGQVDAGSEFQALSAIALPHTSHRRDADSSGATMVAVMRSLYQLIRMLLYPGHGSMLTAPPGSVAGA